MAWKNLSVRTRLLAGFLLPALIGALVAGVGIINLGSMFDEEQAMYERELLGLSHIKEANIALISIGRARGTYLLAVTDEQRAAQLQARERYQAALLDNLAAARPRFVTERANQLFGEIAALEKEYRASQDRFFEIAAAVNGDERDAELARAGEKAMLLGDSLGRALSELSQQKEGRAKAQQEHGAQVYRDSRMVMIGLVALALSASVVLGILLTRSITRPLDHAVALARKVAAGDLSGRVDTSASDEIGQLMRALSDMNQALSAIVGRVRDGTEAISTASSQIAVGNMDLSSRTEQQAGALQETASSMEELTHAVRENAAAANEVNQVAQQAVAVARKGGEAVAQVVATMGGIESSARRIADINGVIEGIAFQTNILALNAAVEAARAGEQGRGFAVVATEVRSLAARSAEAAKQIKELINDSVSQVDSGAQLVGAAGATMGEVVASIERVTALMGGIADASNRQSAGIEQVHRAIGQMDDMTQQNASLVEEAAAAAQSLHDQADGLKQAVSAFKVGAGQPDAAAVSRRQAAGQVRMGVRALPA